MSLLRKIVISGLSLAIATDAYANTVAQCEAEIGIAVPEFDCNDGTLVPTTIHGEIFDDYDSGIIPEYGTDSFKCDRPNVLSGKCDPGSRFQVLTNTPDAYLVAHCRRKGSAEGTYGDIAMIQHNKVTGATCFYQSDVFSKRAGPANNIVRAPSTGQTVARLRSGGCMHCHDNGPLIRTPYLTQITEGDDVIPGAGDNNFNKDQPYYIVGQEHKKTYSVEVQGNNCTACHSLSIWSGGSSFDRNSAGSLALKSTQEFQLQKLPTSGFAPMWMSLTGPGSNAYDPQAYAAAQEIVDCANSATNINNLPNSSTCKVTEKVGRLRKPLSLVSASGQCADIHSGYFNNIFPDAPVKSYECYGPNLNQKWTYTAERTLLSEDGRCLNATGTGTGATVNATTCDGTSSQKWGYNAYTGAITNDGAPNKCLDIWNTNTMQNNQKIQLWDCNGQRNQRWGMADLKYQYLKNDGMTNENLHIQSQTNGVSNLDSGSISAGWWSAQWTIERRDGGYRIRNRWKNSEFLHIENGGLESSAIQPDWESAIWNLKGAPARGADVYTLQNKWKPWLYISLDANGNIQVADKSSAHGDSIFWKLKDVQ